MQSPNPGVLMKAEAQPEHVGGSASLDLTQPSVNEALIIHTRS